MIAAVFALALMACSTTPKQVSIWPSINSVATASSGKGNWTQTTNCRLPTIIGWEIGETVCLVPKGNDADSKEFYSEARQRLLENGWSVSESFRVKKILVHAHSKTMEPYGLHYSNGECASRLLIELDYEQVRPTMVFVRFNYCEA